MASLAVFPKAWLNALCAEGTMKLEEWIELSSAFDVEGLEFYVGFRDLQDSSRWSEYRRRVEDQGRTIPMLCCSPDFTHGDASFRRQEIEKEKSWIDMAVELGASYCRILSGQRRPEVSQTDALNFAIESINDCREYALARGVTLVLENHYKDDFWQYPEFAQTRDIFVELVRRIPVGPGFGVNFDPSNCIICGDDPIALLEDVKDRVATMHASDRYFQGGTLADLHALDVTARDGYASILCHGVIGKGLNDYDQIFKILHEVGFDGWISIEDGTDPESSVADIVNSIVFLREKLCEYGFD